MSSFNLYDILPDKSKEALQSLFKSEKVVQAKPKPQPKLMPKKKNPTTVVMKKSSKASQLFRPLQGKHKAVWNAMTSNDVPESLQRLYDAIKENNKKNNKKKKYKKHYDFVGHMYERTKKDLQFDKKSEWKKENRERIAKSGQVRTIETTSSINAISIPMGGLNKRW